MLETEIAAGVQVVTGDTSVNAVSHEFAQAKGLGINIEEQALPICQEVRSICELLGLEALNFTNEGKLVIVVFAESNLYFWLSLFAQIVIPS